MTAWLRYSVLRLLAFFVPLLLLMAIPWMRENWLVALILAGVLSILLSFFFLKAQTDAMAHRIEERIEHRVEAKSGRHEAGARGARGGHGDGGSRAARAADEDAEDAEISAHPETYR